MPISADTIASMGERLESRLRALAAEKFHSADWVYDLEDGTLLQTIVVYGKIALGVYFAVAAYTEFRQSAIQAYQDAKQFGSVAIQEFQSVTNTSKSDIISKRLTPRDLNLVRRTVTRLDAVRSGSVTGSAAESLTRQLAGDIAALRYVLPEEILEQTVVPAIPPGKLPDMPTQLADIVALDERNRWTHATQRAASERRKLKEGVEHEIRVPLPSSPEAEPLRRLRPRHHFHRAARL